MAFGHKNIKTLDSTIEEIPYVLIGPDTLVLCVMFCWLYRVQMGITGTTYASLIKQKVTKEGC